jgi:hypothetical protein
VRWLRILETSTLGQAWSLIRADSNYTDITQTQYASALEWLSALGLLSSGLHGTALSSVIKELPHAQANQLLFERILEHATPAWLPDADLLIPDATELPQDAAELAVALGLSDEVALQVVRLVHGRIDLAQRSRVGSAGERAVIELLESLWPGSTSHIALTDDGFGYDVLFLHKNAEWHLEIKTTTRRGRLVIYLTRHEHEVGLNDPNWRLIIVGLSDQLQLQALATVQYLDIVGRSPRDLCAAAKWQSASHQLTSYDLQPGLGFLEAPLVDSNLLASQLIRNGSSKLQSVFAWMPRRG